MSKIFFLNKKEFLMIFCDFFSNFFFTNFQQFFWPFLNRKGNHFNNRLIDCAQRIDYNQAAAVFVIEHSSDVML